MSFEEVNRNKRKDNETIRQYAKRVHYSIFALEGVVGLSVCQYEKNREFYLKVLLDKKNYPNTTPFTLLQEFSDLEMEDAEKDTIIDKSTEEIIESIKMVRDEIIKMNKKIDEYHISITNNLTSLEGRVSKIQKRMSHPTEG